MLLDQFIFEFLCKNTQTQKHGNTETQKHTQTLTSRPTLYFAFCKNATIIIFSYHIPFYVYAYILTLQDYCITRAMGFKNDLELIQY